METSSVSGVLVRRNKTKPDTYYTDLHSPSGRLRRTRFETFEEAVAAHTADLQQQEDRQRLQEVTPSRAAHKDARRKTEKKGVFVRHHKRKPPRYYVRNGKRSGKHDAKWISTLDFDEAVRWREEVLARGSVNVSGE